MTASIGNGIHVQNSNGCNIKGEDETDGKKFSVILKPRHSIVLQHAEFDRKFSMSGNGFQLMISVCNVESGVSIAFKQDGQRFGTSSRTYKFLTGTDYKWTFKCKPPIEFNNLHLQGSDLQLVSSNPGEYTAIWNTTGLDPTRKGMRQDILFILSGPNGSLNQKLQTKFYPQGDSHVEWGHKFDSLIWQCEIDLPTGTIAISSEQVL